jgi:hypothetical protein
MIETLVLFYAAWKIEIFIGLFVLALPFLKRRYDNNTLIGSMIQLTTERIAQAMETDPENHPRDKKSKVQRRKKVRNDLAKAARKANRGTSKGNKNGGGKVK